MSPLQVAVFYFRPRIYILYVERIIWKWRSDTKKTEQMRLAETHGVFPLAIIVRAVEKFSLTLPFRTTSTYIIEVYVEALN